MRRERRCGGLSRRAALGATAALLLHPAQGAPVALLPTPASLRAELAAAAARQRALVVLFGVEGCPWCRLVRESYLAPMLAEGQPVVELDMRSAAPVLDWDGRARTQAALARGLKVRVAPTVLFLGPAGREVAARLEGVPLPDFYGAYLEERLAAANRLRG